MVLINSGKPASLTTIRDVENQINVQLTELYISFLLENNGGYPEKSIFKISESQGNSVLNRFYSIEELCKYMSILEDRIPSSFIPIANDPAGNIICLGVKGEHYDSVFFWDHEQETDNADMSNMYYLAKNINEFLKLLHD